MNDRPYPLSIDVRHLVSLFVISILLGSSPTYGQNGSVGVAYPATGINIDGDLSDWPKNATTYPIARVEYGDKLAGKDDLNAKFRVAYIVAEHALYVAVEVSDDSIVLDGPGVARWDAQDGCEVFVNAAHAGSGSPVVQYARYGNQSQVVGPSGATDQAVKVAVARTETHVIYEWRIDLGAELVDDRVIGFDISVADKDKDGSFSWLAWGPGRRRSTCPTAAASSFSFALRRNSARFRGPSPGKTRRKRFFLFGSGFSRVAPCRSGARRSSIRQGPTRPRTCLWAPTRSTPSIRPTSASM